MVTRGGVPYTRGFVGQFCTGMSVHSGLHGTLPSSRVQVWSVWCRQIAVCLERLVRGLHRKEWASGTPLKNGHVDIPPSLGITWPSRAGATKTTDAYPFDCAPGGGAAFQ